MRVWEQSPRVHDRAVCEGMCSVPIAIRPLARLPARARPPATPRWKKGKRIIGGVEQPLMQNGY